MKPTTATGGSDSEDVRKGTQLVESTPPFCPQAFATTAWRKTFPSQLS